MMQYQRVRLKYLSDCFADFVLKYGDRKCEDNIEKLYTKLLATINILICN